MKPVRIYTVGRRTITGDRERVCTDLAHALGASEFFGGSIHAFFDVLLHRFRFGIRSVILATPAAQVALTWWCRLLRIKVIWIQWPAGAQSRIIFPLTLLHRLMSRGVTIVCWFDETAHRLRAAGYRAKQMSVLPLPVDPSRFSQQLSLYDELADRSYQHGLSLCYVVGIITPLVRDCGLEQLLPAVRQLSELIPHLQVIIVGDGPEKKKFTWLSQMLGLQHRVRFVGQQESPQRWYQFFSVTYAPSHTLDGIGLRVAESLFAGIPVMTSPGEGIAQLLGDYDVWLMKDGSSVESIAHAIAEHERHMDRSKSMASVARRNYLETNDIQKTAAILLELL